MDFNEPASGDERTKNKSHTKSAMPSLYQHFFFSLETFNLI